MPALTQTYGLKPWEVAGGPEMLTFGEIVEYRRHYDAQVKAAQAAPKPKGRAR